MYYSNLKGNRRLVQKRGCPVGRHVKITFTSSNSLTIEYI
jgi:hypothetical protein